MPTRYTYDQYSRRLSESELYQRVYEEIENGQMDKAAQARAIEEGGGDDGAVKSAYIKHRIENIRAEIEIAKERAAQEQAKAYAEAVRAKELDERQREKEKQEQERPNLEEKEKILRNIREEAVNRRRTVVLKIYKKEEPSDSNFSGLIIFVFVAFVVLLLSTLTFSTLFLLLRAAVVGAVPIAVQLPQVLSAVRH